MKKEIICTVCPRGCHVMVEKPAGVYTKQVRWMNEEAKKHNVVFGMMFNQRTNCLYRKMKEIIESGELFGIHVEGTRSPDGRLYKGHTGAARLALETGCPIIPTAIIGSREIQKPGQIIPGKGKSTVIYGTPIDVPKTPSDQVTHEMLRELTDRVVKQIQQMSGQEYVPEYAQVVKKQMQEEQQTLDAAKAE